MDIIRKKKLSYIFITIFLIAIYFFYIDSNWQGSTNLHTIMEVIATLLALMIGVSGLIRYNGKPDEIIFLFIGTGFLGTGFLDGYHAIVTSEFFYKLYPSPPESLIPWSWIASRLYLSVFLFIAYYDWTKRVHNDVSPLTPKKVYIITIISTILSFIFFAMVPLPIAYYDKLIFHRPEELLPALFFALALYGFYKKGGWKNNSFEYWLVLSLIVNLISQTIFMSFSHQLFDYKFDMAHLLKKISYISVLIGVFISMLNSFKKEVLISNNLKNNEIKLEKIILDLKEEQDRYKKFMELASDGIHILDKNGNIIEASLSFANMLGFTYEEVLKLNVKDWDRQIPKEELIDKIRNLVKEPKVFITRHKRKDGLILDVQINAKGIELNGEKYLYASSRDITKQKILEEELKDLNKNLEKKVEEEVNARIEKEKLLIAQSRLAQMGEMISNIAHQWRQPLNALGLILQKLDLLYKNDKINEEIMTKSASKGKKLIDKMSHTIDDFRNFFRPNREKIKFNISEAILNSIEIIEIGFNYDNIEIIFNKLDVYYFGYPNELSQVILNILSNSRDAILEKNINNGKVIININLDKNIIINISDNGGGVARDIIHRIFEPYFTTKEQGKGTGIGLYMSKMIIEEHMKGKIFVNNVANGLEFKIELPIYKKEE